MDEASVSQYIIDVHEGIETITWGDNTFFFYGADHRLPLATVVTNDEYDSFSGLDRPGVFRLNVGVSKMAYQTLFGSGPADPNRAGDDSAYDFAALDQLLPHQVYGQMFWVCVLNPSAETFEAKVRPLLDEAVARAVKRAGRVERDGGQRASEG